MKTQFGITNAKIPYTFLDFPNPSNLGKLDHDLTVLPNPGIMVYKGKSSPNGRKIQVSEIF